jgi:hypothetical protein
VDGFLGDHGLAEAWGATTMTLSLGEKVRGEYAVDGGAMDPLRVACHEQFGTD